MSVGPVCVADFIHVPHKLTEYAVQDVLQVLKVFRNYLGGHFRLLFHRLAYN
jgi:hypothetical protein